MIGIVSMNLFSGRRNPSWRLSDADAARFNHLLMGLEVVPAARFKAARAYALSPAQAYGLAADEARALIEAETPGLDRGERLEEDGADVLRRPLSGFRGFEVVFGSDDGRAQRFQTFDRLVLETATGVLRRDNSSPTVEEKLYQTAPDKVVKQLGGMTFAELITAGSETPIEGLEGPDHQLQCESSPEYPGNAGPWKTHKLDNNCYNYANDKLFTTDSGPAVPGPDNDLGEESNPLTETSLKRELGADRLERLGSRLPSSCPPDGAHYLAVVIRHHPTREDVKDFHCIRLDRAGTWSHKDGNDSVRNKDDVERNITDLTTAEFKWTPALVGIYLAFFSKRGLID